MTISKFIRRLFVKKKKSRTTKNSKVLRTWQEMYKDLQTHPLTQAKIINDQLLETTHTTITDFSKRIDSIEQRMNELEKKKIQVVRRVKKGEPAKQEETPKEEDFKIPKKIVKIKKIIADAKLSDQEKEIVKELEKQEELDAETVAQKFNISRSNASLKLNKLYSWGFLDKRMEGKSVFFRLKD